MTLFLTSSPTGPLDGSRAVDGLDTMNGFVEQLAARWQGSARCLIVAASPDEHTGNDHMAVFFAEALERSGLSCACMDLWDSRAGDRDLGAYDVILLGGGHVPTQNAFFHRIALKEKLASFNGIIIGISAGTMNAAGRVYAQPELPGEAADPNYVRWLPGLGLTELNILPHYQMERDSWLDGQRLYEDITYPDSEGHRFLAIPDGSYVLVEDGRAILYGEGYLIASGQLQQICESCKQMPLPHHSKNDIGLVCTGGGFAAPLWLCDACDAKGFRPEESS